MRTIEVSDALAARIDAAVARLVVETGDPEPELRTFVVAWVVAGGLHRFEESIVRMYGAEPRKESA